MRTRNNYGFPTDLRIELEQLVERCCGENAGHAVGDPSISFDGKATRLEVDEHPWWNEIMRIHYLQLVLVGANRIIASEYHSQGDDLDELKELESIDAPRGDVEENNPPHTDESVED